MKVRCLITSLRYHLNFRFVLCCWVAVVLVSPASAKAPALALADEASARPLLKRARPWSGFHCCLIAWSSCFWIQLPSAVLSGRVMSTTIPLVIGVCHSAVALAFGQSCCRHNCKSCKHCWLTNLFLCFGWFSAGLGFGLMLLADLVVDLGKGRTVQTATGSRRLLSRLGFRLVRLFCLCLRSSADRAAGSLWCIGYRLRLDSDWRMLDLHHHSQERDQLLECLDSSTKPLPSAEL